MCFLCALCVYVVNCCSSRETSPHRHIEHIGAHRKYIEMKIIISLYIICIVLSCNDIDTNKTTDRKATDSSTVKSEVAGRKSMKGWELYSWKDTGWKFVLVPGTNRRKSADEILSSRHILNGMKELENEIEKLKDGEIIIVSDGSELVGMQRATQQFRKPTDTLLQQMMQICRRKSIEVLGVVPRPSS